MLNWTTTAQRRWNDRRIRKRSCNKKGNKSNTPIMNSFIIITTVSHPSVFISHQPHQHCYHYANPSPGQTESVWLEIESVMAPPLPRTCCSVSFDLISIPIHQGGTKSVCFINYRLDRQVLIKDRGRRKEEGGGRKEGGGELISTRFIKSEWWRVSDYVPTCPALICGDPRHDKSITINEWATRITCFQKCKVDWCTGTWGATGKREPRWLWLQ